MWKPTAALQMTIEQKRTLKSWVQAGITSQRMVARSKICLLAANGHSNNAISKELKTSRPTVILWRKRFKEEGLLGLSEDAPHGISAQRLDAQKVQAIVDMTLQSTPADATRWSTRTMAKELGISHSSVARILNAYGLQPHRTKTFKLSRDKHFVEKLTDVVGLYLNPPDKALVLCADEKSQRYKLWIEHSP